MRDDNVQGILFSHSTSIDLTKKSRYQKIVVRVMSGKRGLAHLLNKTSPKQKMNTPDRSSVEYKAVRGGADRSRDLEDVIHRLKRRY